MAQFYYDMTICKPNKWPLFFKGNRPALGSAVLAMGVNKASASPYFSQKKNGSENIWYVPTFGINEADVEVLVKYKIPPFSSLSGGFSNTGPVGIFLRTTPGPFTGQPSKSYYAATGGQLSDYDKLSLWKRDTLNSIPQTQVGGITGPTISIPSFPNTMDLFAFLKFRVNGTTLQVKHWLASDTEPVGFAINTTDSSITTAGDVGIYFSGYMGEVGVSFVSIGTGGDTAPLTYPGGNRIIAGTLLKPDGAPAGGYMARCYHRETGVILGEVLANELGAFNFSLPIPATEKVYCVGVDQLGNTWNAPIKDLISPVSP